LIAEGLATNGMTVYIVSRREHVLNAVVKEWDASKKPGYANIVALAGDLSSKEKIADLVARYRQKESKLDLLVNNAGVFKGFFAKDVLNADAVETDAVAYEWDDFASTFDVNVTAMWFTTAYFLPLLRRTREEVFGSDVASPVVVNVSSAAGLHIARMQMPAYSASKAGVNHLTRVMAGKVCPVSNCSQSG
jgi:NAD(P)-dependent dehydrogenase (short-subunit alcohol dehydrogenase family)